jgi:hypothetical protein
MNRKAWIVFILLQLVGLVGSLVGPHVLWGGAEMFFVGFVLLLPGSLAAVAITEKLLWGAMGLRGMTVTEVILELLINLLVWLACVKLVSLWRLRRSSRAK